MVLLFHSFSPTQALAVMRKMSNGTSLAFQAGIVDLALECTDVQ